jgi:hypothetical protein
VHQPFEPGALGQQRGQHAADQHQFDDALGEIGERIRRPMSSISRRSARCCWCCSRSCWSGAVLGLTARLAITALQVTGSVIAQQLGLGFVTAVDPTQNQQGLLVGNFLTVFGVTLIFATDMHHLVIAALNDSYTIFQPSEIPPTGRRRGAARHRHRRDFVPRCV